MHINQTVLDYINTRSAHEFEPYYLYDTQKIRRQCRQFQQLSYPEKSVHFATMANIHPHFLRIVKEEGIHVFVNSLPHLDAVQQAGFGADEIIFTSSGLSEKTMRNIAGRNVQVNLDSPMQLALWRKLFPDRRVGIRCNIGNTVKPLATHAGFFIGENSRLGFTEEEIKGIENRSIIKGLHLYAGTDIFDIDYFMHCYRELARLIVHFPYLEYLNVGGGFGVSENGDKRFDFARYDILLTAWMNEVSHRANRPLKLLMEPGRIIGGEAGFFVCSVTDIKNRAGKRLIGVNASTAQFSRPMLYPGTAQHPVVPLRDGKLLQEKESNNSTIFGCSTYSRDIFRDNVPLPELQIGDTLVFCNAGSYSASSHLHFLGFPKAEEIFV